MINIAVAGYGNLGKAVISALKNNKDMSFVALFSRRPEEVNKVVKDVPVLSSENISLPRGLHVDVAILCGGSKDDTPRQGPLFAHFFNTVDSFDTHAEIPQYFGRMDVADRENGHVSIISAGWDPGILSMERVLGDAFLPKSTSYTFWGPGVSQGHSNAARGVKGVLDARSYTIPIDKAIQKIRNGDVPMYSSRDMHRRRVYVVAEEGAAKKAIQQSIMEMPDYFAGYDVEVIFISQDEMDKNHSAIPHGGSALTSGFTGEENNRQIIEYRLQLQNNPEFTGSVLVACARAAYRMHENGSRGCFTMLDVPPALFSPRSSGELRSRFM